ncbi:MAG: enoyl-CoA hydratase/isomerase family protein [Archaeoglobaceae archaeon]|nr:enoyl-CoA hydratase/isomerase family protein [Archaeoglobaceae archaeon]MCX8151696.1 enoyl-CoA hydratase/isomerase family protein [Archaeoglobaceae archaeon]MDW8013026.1 enoyl-CoA hydratase/isomerase family protein [Archaeoglobaceae archaeon]
MKVEYLVEDDIATIKFLDEKIPLLTKNSLEKLYDAFLLADKDEKVNGIILTSAGKDFCGGADLKELIELDFEGCVRWFETYWKVIDIIRSTGKPVLAAVKGVCVAGGNEIAMACDFVIAARSARFGQPEVRVGSTAMGLGVQLLPLLVGERKARELLLTGKIIDAEEALKIGLINDVVDDDELMKRSRDYLREIFESVSPQAFKIIKSGLKFWTDVAMLNYQLARDLTSMVWLSGEFRERAKDFLEKRKLKKRKFIGVR